MLLNERSFDKLFCDVSNTNRFDLYYNQHFSDDPVFNHVVVDDSVMESPDELDDNSLSILLHEIKTEADQKDVSPTIFIERFWNLAQRLEKSAIEDNFRIAGMMEILSKEVVRKTTLSPNRAVDVVETKDFGLWNQIFMRSFLLNPLWEAELLKREEMFNMDQSTILFVAREHKDDRASGCMLLHRIPKDYLGIYCVGALPERRNRGIAAAMMAKAETYAAEVGCKYLTLQTVTNDGVTPMYTNMGFKIDFERDLLQLP